MRAEEPADLVIVDYGLSFNMQDGDDQDTVTVTGEMFQNKFLDLPETNTPTGNKRDPRSDLTALCGVFFFCLTGHCPGQLRDERGQPPHSRDACSVKMVLSPDVRLASVEAVLDRAFELDIQSRFQSIEELKTRFHRIGSRSAQGEGLLDPYRVDGDLLAHVRKHDAQARINEIKQIVGPVLGGLKKKISRIATRFQSVQTSVSSGIACKPKLVEGVEFLQSGLTVIVSLKLNPDRKRVLLFAVGARASECVILRAVANSRAANPKVGEVCFQEVLWFNAKEPPSADTLTPIVEEGFTLAMLDFMNEVPEKS